MAVDELPLRLGQFGREGHVLVTDHLEVGRVADRVPHREFGGGLGGVAAQPGACLAVVGGRVGPHHGLAPGGRRADSGRKLPRRRPGGARLLGGTQVGREEGEPFGEARAGWEGDGDLGVGQHHHGLVTRLAAQHGEEFEYGVLGSDAHQDIDHGQSCLSRAPTGRKGRPEGANGTRFGGLPPRGLDLSRWLRRALGLVCFPVRSAPVPGRLSSWADDGREQPRPA